MVSSPVARLTIGLRLADVVFPDGPRPGDVLSPGMPIATGTKFYSIDGRNEYSFLTLELKMSDLKMIAILQKHKND